MELNIRDGHDDKQLGTFDLKSITKGNEAAHRGNVVADEALFHQGRVDAKDRSRLGKAFQLLYGIAPPDNDTTIIGPKISATRIAPIIDEYVDMEASIGSYQIGRNPATTAVIDLDHRETLQQWIVNRRIFSQAGLSLLWEHSFHVNEELLEIHFRRHITQMEALLEQLNEERMGRGR